MRGLALLLAVAAPVAADPSDPARRTLAWLLTREAPAAVGADATSSGKRVCALAATGLLLELHPDTPDFARHRARIRAALAPLIRGATPIVQNTWSDGFFALYLAERHARGARDPELWRALVRRVETRQNAEGGWGHGGLEIGFYPSTLVAATNLSVLALGLARRCGADVDGEVLARAFELYGALQAPSGAWPYGGRAYRKGYEAGRTTGAVLALLAAGAPDAGVLDRAKRYLERNAAAVPRGHASPAMHILTGAFAYRAMGRADLFERAVGARVRACARPDGTFRDALGTSPDSLTIMGAAEARDMYLSALYAVAVAADRSKALRARTTPAVDAPAAPRPRPRPDALAPAWTADGIAVASLGADTERILVGAADGAVVVLAPDGSVDRRLDPEEEAVLGGGLVQGRLVVVRGPRPGEDMPQSVASALARRRDGAWTVTAYDPGDGRALWTHRVASMLHGFGSTPARLHLHTSGGVTPIDLATGKAGAPLGVPETVVNAALAFHADGSAAVTGEGSIRVCEPDGRVRWERIGRRKRNLTPAARGAVAWDGDRLLEGATDGMVRCRDGATGKVRWRAPTGAAVVDLEVAGGTVVALGWDGAVHAWDRDGKPAWRYVPPVAGESSARPQIEVAGAHVVARVPTAPWLVVLRAGKPVARVDLPEAAHWTVAAGRVYVGGPDGVRAYDLPR